MHASLVGEKAVQPGEKRQVEVDIGTAGRTGVIAKAATVKTDHPDFAMVPLKVTVEVTVDLDFAAPVVFFQDAVAGKPSEQTVEFVAEDPGSVKFGGVEVTGGDAKDTGGGVKAKMVKTGAGAAARWSLVVTTSPKASGPIGGNIRVELLEPEEKTLQVNYSGAIKAAAPPD